MLDKENNLVRFQEENKPDATFELPYDDELFKNNKVGDCGKVKTKKEEVQMQSCTGFAMEPGQQPQQREMQNQPMSK